jgi:hypothetical protein
LPFLYSENISSRDRFDNLELQMDNGTTAIIQRGKAYVLTATEVARARRYVVLVPTSGVTSDPKSIAQLPVVGEPQDGDMIVWSDSVAAFTPIDPANVFAGGGDGGGGGGTTPGELDGYTVDTSEHYRLIMLSSGTVRAIPYGAVPPAMPTSLSAQARLTSVTLSWIAVSGASSYVIRRDGIQIGTSNTNSFRDRTVLAGATYAYRVAALDQYDQQSAFTASANAFINPALNSAPTVEITTWPPQVNPSGVTIIRVNASDADAQVLALQLNVSAGSLQPTADRSVWLLTI